MDTETITLTSQIVSAYVEVDPAVWTAMGRS